MKTVMFTGHRNSKREARLDVIGLGKLLKHLIEGQGHASFHFIAGGCPGFDTLAMDVLRDLEVKESDCTLYLPSEKPVVDSKDELGTAAAKLVFDRISNKVIIKTGDTFGAKCMMRNQSMVHDADICITNLTESSGGTFQTVKMAKKKDIQIYYIKGDTYESVNAK
jgi:hypothetical protein